MSAEFFPVSPAARARIYAKMGATDRAIALLKSTLDRNPADADALSYLVELYRGTFNRWNEFEANKVCLDYLKRNTAGTHAPGLVLSLLNFDKLTPVETLAVCENIAALDPSQRPAVHAVYNAILTREAPPSPPGEEAAAMAGSAGYWPPETLTLEDDDRELFLIHASIDDRDEPAAIDHLHRALARRSAAVPLLLAWGRFLASECGSHAEDRYPELATRMAELEKRSGAR